MTTPVGPYTPVVRSGDWWYYTRTFEGAQYAAHCRAPVGDHPARPEPEPGS